MIKKNSVNIVHGGALREKERVGEERDSLQSSYMDLPICISEHTHTHTHTHKLSSNKT